MEDIPMKLDHADILQNEPFVCKSIFENPPFARETNVPLHLYYNTRDLIPVNHHFTSVDSQVDFGMVGRGTFHLLQLMHKFPILQKFQGNQHASSTSSAFVEVLVLPWDLLISDTNTDTHIDKLLIDRLKESMNMLNRTENGKPVGCERHKTDQLSDECLTSAFNDSDYEWSCRSSHPAYATGFVVDPEETPCLVTGNCVSHPSFGILQHRDTQADVGSCCKPQGRKALLELKSETFSVYEVLKIGNHYLIKHQKDDMLCSDATGDKIVVNSGTNIWSVSFSSVNALQNLDVSCLFQQSDSLLSHNRVLPDGYHQSQIPNCLPKNGCGEIFSDVNLYMPPDMSSLFDVNLEDTLLKRLVPCGEVTNINRSDHNLPEGNLISIHGQIKAIHFSDGKSYAQHLRCENIIGVCPSLFVEGTSSICVHVLTDNKMVKIFGAANTLAYPAGFGRGVTASFHRVLALSVQDNFMVIPTSFIVMNPSSLMNDHGDDANTYVSAASDLDGSSPSSAITTSLFSDTVKSLETQVTQPMEFHCRVVAVYILVLEYNRKGKFRQSRTESKLDSCGVDIPLAGFIFDDGSSSCCCWASWEMAALFLGLHDEQGSGETYAITRKRSRKSRKKQASSSLTTIAHLRRIMKRHGRVTVRNQASAFDSSCQDLLFSAKPSKIISCSDQDFFQSLILKACCNALLTVVGSLMSSDTSRRLETHLSELGMVMLPMKNIWVSEVRHMDSLNQAKKILHGLVQS